MIENTELSKINHLIAERNHLRSIIARMEKEMEVIMEEVKTLRLREAQYAGEIED